MLLVDAANVIGSRPNGWWRDRPGAARTFVAHIRAATQAGRLGTPVIVVLEGASRRGVQEGTADGVTVIHAPGSGDDRLVAVAAETGDPVTLVSADRGLRQRVEALGADVRGPSWLTNLLEA